jgi:hypothetical protein
MCLYSSDTLHPSGASELSPQQTGSLPCVPQDYGALGQPVQSTGSIPSPSFTGVCRCCLPGSAVDLKRIIETVEGQEEPCCRSQDETSFAPQAQIPGIPHARSTHSPLYAK